MIFFGALTPFQRSRDHRTLSAGFNAGSLLALNDRQAFLAQWNQEGPTGPGSQPNILMALPVQTSAWEESADKRYAFSRERQGRPAQSTDRETAKKNSPSTSLWRLIYQDYRRHRAAGAKNALSVIALTQGFWASFVFRASHWALGHSGIPILRTVVKAGCVLSQKFIEIITGICVPGRCDIGPGLYIGHFGNIFVDSETRIGANCNLAQGVTIGKGGRGELHGVPVLGDRVHIGANAIILGKITIGNDAAIGPGAIVMNSVPACGVAMGNPARIVGTSGSFEFVNYDGMEHDPARNPPNQIDRESVHAKEQ